MGTEIHLRDVVDFMNQARSMTVLFGSTEPFEQAYVERINALRRAIVAEHPVVSLSTVLGPSSRRAFNNLKAWCESNWPW